MRIVSTRQRGRGASKHAQRGMGGVWAVGAIVVAVLGAGMLALAWEGLVIDRSVDQANEKALSEAKRRLEAWYRARPAQGEPANYADAVAIADIRTAINLDTLKPTPKLARASYRASAQGVAYSRYLLWLPSATATDTTRWDASSGAWIVASGARAVEFTGQAIQLERHIASVKRAQDLAQKLEIWFAWQVQMDPSHARERNYFRAKSCASPTANELGCYAANSAVGSTDLGTRIGVTASAYTDAWGRELEIDNVPPPSGGDIPPFRAKLRFVPPGTADLNDAGANRALTFPVTVTAIQRLS